MRFLLTLILAGAFVTVTPQASDEALRISEKALTNAQSTTEETPPPVVSPKFKPAIHQAAVEGLRLKEAIEVSLDGASEQLAAIFQRRKDSSLDLELEGMDLRIFESDGKTVTTLFHQASFHYTFFDYTSDWKQVPNPLNATDINGDGLKELIVYRDNGGNCWDCSLTEIYQVQNHAVSKIASAPIRNMIDLDNDGILELVVGDNRWENYDDFAHAAAPSAVKVYGWRTGHYVLVSRDFPAFYRDELKSIQEQIDEYRNEQNEEGNSRTYFEGAVLSLLITYAEMGRPEHGLKRARDLFNSVHASRWIADWHSDLLEEFRNGKSAQTLRAIQYGDVLPPAGD